MTVNDSSPPEPAPAAMVTSGEALGRAFLPEVAAFCELPAVLTRANRCPVRRARENTNRFFPGQGGSHTFASVS